MSKSTIVSTLPFALREPKPGLTPYMYEVPAARDGKVSVLVVGEAFYQELIPYGKYSDLPRNVPVTSEKVAQGIIDDYINAQLSVSYDPLSNGATPIPGMFWVEGVESADSVVLKYPKKFKQAILNTTAWFQRLVTLADDDWKKHGQHKMITDLSRAACSYLELQRDWNFDAFEAVVNRCWACKIDVRAGAMVCSGCSAILDADAYEKSRKKFANAV